MDEPTLIKWINGLDIEGHFVKPVGVKRIGHKPLQCCFEVILAEGLKREVRMMARALDNDVRRLERRKIGKLELRDLPVGEYISVSKEDLWNYIRHGKTI